MNDEIQLVKMKQRCNVFSKVRSRAITNNPFFKKRLLTKDRKRDGKIDGNTERVWKMSMFTWCTNVHMGEESGFVQSDICQFKGTLKANVCSHVQAVLNKIEISSQLIDETHFLVTHFCSETI